MTSAPKHVAVHPIVLLSVVDHFNRVVVKSQNKRVVGVLLGEYYKGQLDVTNSYAIPFEEDPQQQNVWFLDHLYHEQMYNMFKKISAKEKVVGWYTTGNKFKQHDLEIHELFRKYTPNPVLIIIDPEHQDQLAIPTEAYISQDEVRADGKQVKVFVHVPSSVEATEPEEIGVEALLREIKDISLNSLGSNVNQKLLSLKGLIEKMSLIKTYLDNVVDQKIKPNNEILFNLQEIFNYLPNINDPEIIKSTYIKNNDMMFVIYICSLIRSTISLHNLINNKLQIKEQEQKQNTQLEQKAKDIKDAKESKEKTDQNQKDNKNEAKK